MGIAAFEPPQDGKSPLLSKELRRIVPKLARLVQIESMRFTTWKMVLKQPRWLLGLLLFSHCIVTPAAEVRREYLHQIWRSEEGLPDPVVRQIIQARDGYLWLATEESLMRFDGERFSDIFQKTNPEKIDRWFTALIQTRDGAIWCSSPNGGLRFAKGAEKKQFQMKDGLPSNYIMSLCEDKQGSLWIGTSAGLSCFTNGTFVNFTNKIPGLVQSPVRALLEDHEGNLWIGTAQGISKKTGNTFTSHTNDFTVSASIMSLYEDREHRLWIGTGKGLTLYENGVSKHYTEDDGLAHGTVRAVLEDRHGNIWVGSQGGVQHFVDGKLITPIVHSTSDFDDGISFVYTMTEDTEGDIWVGTSVGLNRLKPQRFQILSKENGLGVNMATLVYQDHTGAKWVGTYGGGLTQIKDGRMTTFNTGNGLPTNFILALCEDRDGTLWIGTEGAGLVRYRDGKFTQYLQTQDVRMNTIRVIYEDKKGDLWIGSNSSIGRFKDGNFINEKIVIVGVRAILEGRDGNLWVGSRTGLMQWTNGVVNTYMKRNGLAGTQITSLFEDFDGVLWIGTDAGGLSRYKNGKFTSYGLEEGFFKERVLHMLDDGAGDLWMATRNGIFSVKKKELHDLAEGNISEVTLLSFGKKDGLKRAQCNSIAQPSGWKMDDGTLWFAAVHGAVSFDPREVASNSRPPPVAIEKLSVDGKLIELRPSIQIAPGHGNLEIEYTALSFQQSDRVKFKYKLDGFDTSWQDVGIRRVATYNNLQPGNYDFHVIACNNDGVWNEEGAMLAFELQPHFYQTYTFYGACILIAGFGTFGIYRLRIQRLQHHQRHLAALVEERTQALQQEILERKQTEEALRKSQEMVLRQERLAVVGQLAAGIAHEFNNILTVVQGHTCLLMTSDTISNEEKEPLQKISVAADRAANL
ncbi:MAG: Blue-light-activated protein, partial [Verrucomicrobiales bacterium]|nr:Blue-light-activated protein [Verrucomicrobiales bacterium]